MLSPHQLRQAGALAFRNRQRGVVAPRWHRPAVPRLPAPMPARELPAPSIEERLCAAAHRILSDGRVHSMQAQAWALRFLEQCTPGRDRTTFVRSVLRGMRPQAIGQVAP